MSTQYYTRNNVTFGVNVPDGYTPSDAELDSVFARATHDQGVKMSQQIFKQLASENPNLAYTQNAAGIPGLSHVDTLTPQPDQGLFQRVLGAVGGFGDAIGSRLHQVDSAIAASLLDRGIGTQGAIDAFRERQAQVWNRQTDDRRMQPQYGDVVGPPIQPSPMNMQYQSPPEQQFAPNFYANLAPGMMNTASHLPYGIGGLVDATTGLMSPANLALLGGLGLAGRAAAGGDLAASLASGAGKAATVGFAAPMLQSGYQGIFHPAANADTNDFSKAMMDSAFGVLGAAHVAGIDGAIQARRQANAYNAGPANYPNSGMLDMNAPGPVFSGEEVRSNHMLPPAPAPDVRDPNAPTLQVAGQTYGQLALPRGFGFQVDPFGNVTQGIETVPTVRGTEVYPMPGDLQPRLAGQSYDQRALPPGSDNALPPRPGDGYTVDPQGNVQRGFAAPPTVYGQSPFVVDPSGNVTQGEFRPGQSPAPLAARDVPLPVGSGAIDVPAVPVGPTHTIGDTPVTVQETPTTRRVFRDANGNVVKLAGRKAVPIEGSPTADLSASSTASAQPLPASADSSAPGQNPAGVPGSVAPLTQSNAQVPQIPMPALATQPRPDFAPTAVGSSGVTFTPNNTSVPFHYAVAPLDSLTTSHTGGFAENAQYDQVLQPRDRTRMASQEQVVDLAQRLEPARMAAAPTTTDGAPLVGADGQVESGNARTMALRLAYEQNLPGAAAYRDYLRQNASAFGIDPSHIDQTDKPVLVRVSDIQHATPEARGQFAQEAGAPTVASMSAPETAAADAARIMQSGSLGSYDSARALTSLGNRGFVERFMAGMSPAERASMIDAEGNISSDGVRRMRAALIATAYSDPATLDRLLESTDDTIRNVGRGMELAAPRIAELKQKIAAGQLWPLDISSDVEAAANQLAALKDEQRSAQYKASGASPLSPEVRYHLAQGDLMGTRTWLGDQLLQVLDSSRRSAVKIDAFLRQYASVVESMGPPGDDLFGGREAPTKEEAFKATLRTMGEDVAETGSRVEPTRQLELDSPASATSGDTVDSSPAAGDRVVESSEVRGTEPGESQDNRQQLAQVEEGAVSSSVPAAGSSSGSRVDFTLTGRERRGLIDAAVGERGRNPNTTGALRDYLPSDDRQPGAPRDNGSFTPEQLQEISRLAKLGGQDDLADRAAAAAQRAQDLSRFGDGPVAMNSGITPQNVRDAFSQIRDSIDNSGALEALRNMALEGGSHLRKMAPISFEKAVEYSTARSYASEMARQRIPQVLAPMGEHLQKRFGAYLVADRALSERDSMRAEVAEHQAELPRLNKAISAAERALDKLQAGKDGQVFADGLDKARAVRQAQSAIDDLRSQRREANAAIAHANDMIDKNIITRTENRGSDPFLDPVSGRALTEDRVRRFFAEPQVQEAVRLHRSLIEPEMASNYAASGKIAAGDRGKYSDAWAPAIAVGEDGAPKSSGSGGGGAFGPLAETPSTPGSRQFTGTAHGYMSDYADAIKSRMIAGRRTAAYLDMVRRMARDGVIAQAWGPTHKINGEEVVEHVDDAGDTSYRNQANRTVDATGQAVTPMTETDRTWRQQLVYNGHGTQTRRYEVLRNGQWSRATSPFNIQERFAAQYPDLPTTVLMDAHAYNEIKPLLDKNAETDLSDTVSKIGSATLTANLAGVGDAAAHGRAETSRLAKMLPAVGGRNSVVGKVLVQLLPQINSMLQLRNTVGRSLGIDSYSVADRNAAALEAAKCGALPREFGLQVHAGDNALQAGVKFGARALYGENGIHINALTTIYKAFADTGLLSSSNPDRVANLIEMRNMMRNLNTYTDFLQSDLQRNLPGRTKGLVGSFVQTGIRNRTAAYYGGPKAVITRAVGSMLFASLLTKITDPEHRWPWQIPGATPGSVYAGQDARGQHTWWNLSDFLDRSQGYADAPLRSVMKSYAAGDNLKVGAARFGTDMANQVLEPITSGPAVGLGMDILARKSPYLVPDNRLFMDTETSKLPPLSALRMASLGQHVLPILNIGGNVDQSMGKSAPQGTPYSLANGLLRMTGSPAVRAVNEGAVRQRAAIEDRRK